MLKKRLNKIMGWGILALSLADLLIITPLYLSTARDIKWIAVCVMVSFYIFAGFLAVRCIRGKEATIFKWRDNTLSL